MPSPDTLILALLILAVLVVGLANLWLLTQRRSQPQPRPRPHAPLDDIPAPREPFPPSPPPVIPQAVLDARYAQQQRRRAAPTTRRLAESGWYGGVPWGGSDERDGDAQWPQAR
jgi:hypothetical protein